MLIFGQMCHLYLQLQISNSGRGSKCELHISFYRQSVPLSNAVFVICKLAILAHNLISSSIKFYQPQNTNSFTGNKMQFNAIQLYLACILKIFPKLFYSILSEEQGQKWIVRVRNPCSCIQINIIIQ